MDNLLLTKENLGIERVTPSGLDCFESCPRLFYYREWLGLKLDNDKRHMDFGTAIHSAIETIYGEYDNHFGGAWEYADARKVTKTFSKKWTENLVTEESFQSFLKTKAGKESGFKNKKELYHYMKSDGIVMLKSYWKEKERLLVEYEHDFNDFEIALKVEICNPLKLEEKLPVPLSMRIDAMNKNRTKLVDFKTSKGSYNLEETRKKIQGQCYLFGWLMSTGELITNFDYIVLRKELKSPDRIEVVQLKYDKADMVSLYFRIKSILLKIAQRQFDRPVLGHDKWCDCLKYEEQLSVKEKDLLVNK